jgi:hypothetical protein
MLGDHALKAEAGVIRPYSDAEFLIRNCHGASFSSAQLAAFGARACNHRATRSLSSLKMSGIADWS